MSHAAILALALVLDAVLGEPERLWRRVPHPAVLMGRAVAWAEQRFNRANAGRAGLAVIAGLGAAAFGLGAGLAALPGGDWIALALAAVLLAQRSLADHVRAVAEGLHAGPQAGRAAVARIVGRDTADLDESAVARAAIESAAENLSDGVVAPAFWFLLLGLPGLLVYKLVNTADSMIGHRTPRYRAFGRASARLDDLLNWIPARLTAVIILAAHWRLDALGAVARQAPRHRSPNAGWPEAAMAHVLGVALSGPRSYAGGMRDFAWLNRRGRQTLVARDVERAVTVLWRSWSVLLVAAGALALVW